MKKRLLLKHLVFIQIMMLFLFSTEARTIRVGVYDNPPKVFYGNDGKADGIFIDILEEIAEKEDWDIEYVYGSWDKCLTYLNNGTIDIMPDIAKTNHRQIIFDFNRITVLPSWIQFYSRKKDRLLSYNDLDGKTIAVLDGSIQEEYCQNIAKRLNLDIKFLIFSNYSDSIDAILFKRVDALIASRFLIFSSIGKHLEPSPIILDTSTLHYATLSGYNTELLNIIDKHLIEYLNDPRSIYYSSIEKWLHKSPKYFIPQYIIIVLLTITIITLLSIAITLILKSKINEKTKELKTSLVREESANNNLKRSLEEKETLLHELYHRTGNYMNVIISMLSLKADEIGDENINKYKSDIENRIYPMMSASNLLYQTGNLNEIDVNEYISSLSGKILSQYPFMNNRVSFDSDIEELNISIDTALPLGQILVELLANSYEHAFPERKHGTIKISIKKNRGFLDMLYSDDGIGISKQISIDNIQSLGMKLIYDIVVNQLNGKVDILSIEGVTYNISFPV